MSRSSPGERNARVGVLAPRGARTDSKRNETKKKKTEKTHNQIWNFNLKNLSISNQKETIKLNLDEGPYNMLYSGKWDATSQLLDEEEKINKTFHKLPYLNSFKSEI